MTSNADNFVTHLECSQTGRHYPAGELHGLSEAGMPLLVRYDLEAVGAQLDKAAVALRSEDLWRYHELLPVNYPQDVVSLGEQFTPLISCTRLAARLGLKRVDSGLLIKDEGRLPTGSFKSRGLCVAVSMASALGVTRMAMPTAGNAGAALAAYCSRAGMEAYVFCPEDAPEINVRETAMQGGRVYRVNGLIHECGSLVQAGKDSMQWFDASTLKEPYRLEGKKTMGLELAEQLGWRLPDAILYPTGGGTGLIGMWKAFEELAALGWIGAERPRMIAVQSTGCAPIVEAFEAGLEKAKPVENPHTIAPGIRVPAAIGDFLILRAIRESQGLAVAVEDEAILAARDEVGRGEGLLLCPEGAATYAAYRQLLQSGDLRDDDQVVLFNCGNGLKYDMPPVDAFVDRHAPFNLAQN